MLRTIGFGLLLFAATRLISFAALPLVSGSLLVTRGALTVLLTAGPLLISFAAALAALPLVTSAHLLSFPAALLVAPAGLLR